MEITTNETPICLINIYMPSEQKNGDINFKDTLCELSEIIETYRSTHQVIIAGDMNASLQRDIARDKLFQSFVRDNHLDTLRLQSSDPTFYHHNGKFKSKIDYFLFNTDAASKV